MAGPPQSLPDRPTARLSPRLRPSSLPPVVFSPSRPAGRRWAPRPRPRRSAMRCSRSLDRFPPRCTHTCAWCSTRVVICLLRGAVVCCACSGELQIFLCQVTSLTTHFINRHSSTVSGLWDGPLHSSREPGDTHVYFPRILRHEGMPVAVSATDMPSWRSMGVRAMLRLHTAPAVCIFFLYSGHLPVLLHHLGHAAVALHAVTFQGAHLAMYIVYDILHAHLPLETPHVKGPCVSIPHKQSMHVKRAQLLKNLPFSRAIHTCTHIYMYSHTNTQTQTPRQGHEDGWACCHCALRPPGENSQMSASHQIDCMN